MLAGTQPFAIGPCVCACVVSGLATLNWWGGTQSQLQNLQWIFVFPNASAEQLILTGNDSFSEGINECYGWIDRWITTPHLAGPPSSGLITNYPHLMAITGGSLASSLYHKQIAGVRSCNKKPRCRLDDPNQNISNILMDAFSIFCGSYYIPESHFF
jgi:hypothetical protein